MKLNDLILFYEKKVPLSLQEEWDHSGIQLGDFEGEVDKVLLALDIDDDCIDYAIDQGFQLIFTHHPLLFHTLKKITTDSIREKQVRRLIQNDIYVYSSHTNLDSVKNGVNDILAERLELTDTKIFSVNEKYPEHGLGRIGFTTYKTAKEFATMMKKNLSLDHVIYYGSLDHAILKVAVIGGAGASFVAQAKAQQCDVLVTSDVKYHEADEAQDIGLLLFDIGHYESERCILYPLKTLLESLPISVEIFERRRPTRNIF